MLERLLWVLAVALVTASISFLVRAVTRQRVKALAGDLLSLDVAERFRIEGPGIIYFSGPHCAPCARQAAILDDLARETDVHVITVDAAQEAELASRFHVMTVPATVIVDGERRVRAVNLGLQPLPVLQEQLAQGSPGARNSA